MAKPAAPAVVSHYNATPAIDIYGTVQGTDLGYVAAEIDKVVAQAKKDLPKGSNVVLRGQVQTMKASFNDEGQLVAAPALKFPTIPGVNVVKAAYAPRRLDFGHEPPKTSEAFPALVPQVDADGNETSGIRLPELRFPLATYMGWNLRNPSVGAPTEQYPSRWSCEIRRICNRSSDPCGEYVRESAACIQIARPYRSTRIVCRSETRKRISGICLSDRNLAAEQYRSLNIARV